MEKEARLSDERASTPLTQTSQNTSTVAAVAGTHEARGRSPPNGPRHRGNGTRRESQLREESLSPSHPSRSRSRSRSPQHVEYRPPKRTILTSRSWQQRRRSMDESLLPRGNPHLSSHRIQRHIRSWKPLTSIRRRLSRQSLVEADRLHRHRLSNVSSQGITSHFLFLDPHEPFRWNGSVLLQTVCHHRVSRTSTGSSLVDVEPRQRRSSHHQRDASQLTTTLEERVKEALEDASFSRTRGARRDQLRGCILHDTMGTALAKQNSEGKFNLTGQVTTSVSRYVDQQMAEQYDAIRRQYQSVLTQICERGGKTEKKGDNTVPCVVPSGGDPLSTAGVTFGSVAIHMMEPEAADAAQEYLKLTDEDRYERAAAFVRDAVAGRGPTGEAMVMGSKDKWARRSFLIYHSRAYSFLYYCIVVGHMLLAIWEAPSTQEHRGGRATLSPYLLASIQVFCAVFYLGDTALKRRFMGNSVYWASRWRISLLGVQMLIFLDALLSFVVPRNCLRFSRPFRPLLLFCRNREWKSLFTTVGKTLANLSELAYLIAFLLLLYAIVGMQLFHDRYFGTNGEPLRHDNFDNFHQALVSLFVLLTTENYPDVMYPATDLSPFYGIFFASFFFLGTFVFMSIVLAVVVDVYKGRHMENVVEDRVNERKALLEAFFLLDQAGRGFFDFDVWWNLMKELKPEADPLQVSYLFDIIDQDGNGVVDVLEFFEMSDVLQLRFRKEMSVNKEHRSSNFEELLEGCMKSRWFSGAVFLVAMANVILLAFLGGTSSIRTIDTLTWIDNVFLAFFAAEVMIRIVSTTFSLFWCSYWNRTDAFVILIAILMKIVVAIPFLNIQTGSMAFRVCIAASAVRMIRLLSLFDRCRVIVSTLVRILPFMAGFGVLLVVISYVYAILGMELLAGKWVEEGSPYLNARSDFDSLGKAFISLLQLLVTNNWHEIMYEAMDATSPAMAWFFVSYFIIVVLIVFNLLIALILDVFTIQRELRTEDGVRIQLIDENDTGAIGRTLSPVLSHHKGEEDEEENDEEEEEEEEGDDDDNDDDEEKGGEDKREEEENADSGGEGGENDLAAEGNAPNLAGDSSKHKVQGNQGMRRKVPPVTDAGVVGGRRSLDMAAEAFGPLPKMEEGVRTLPVLMEDGDLLGDSEEELGSLTPSPPPLGPPSLHASPPPSAQRVQPTRVTPTSTVLPIPDNESVLPSGSDEDTAGQKQLQRTRSKPVVWVVEKGTINWSREIVRNALPDMVREELARITPMAGMDLLEMQRRKEEEFQDIETRRSNALRSLHSVMYGARFVSNMKASLRRRRQAGIETPCDASAQGSPPSITPSGAPPSPGPPPPSPAVHKRRYSLGASGTGGPLSPPPPCVSGHTPSRRMSRSVSPVPQAHMRGSPTDNLDSVMVPSAALERKASAPLSVVPTGVPTDYRIRRRSSSVPHVLIARSPSPTSSRPTTPLNPVSENEE